MSHDSFSKVCKYDVFLSFRGKDTRRTIVSHLYNALEQRGIHTFKDDERLETGKSISSELSKAIKEARFAVVIFSSKYASSRWCLEELAHIIKCKNELEQNVIPVFYDVSPSDVRHQNPPFAKSFSKHEKKYKDDLEKVQTWRDAFAEAGNMSGYHLKNFKDEADCIKKLVDDIFPKSLQVISPFPERLVGMKSQVEKVTSLLDMESNDVRSIGIWGMGGIGKTEIARVLYQRYRHRFEDACFLGVGTLYQSHGLTGLVQVVICKLLGQNMTLASEHEGVIILENMLRRKKVLFILDDVNHREQLEFLVGGTERFGRGSRIILTARDKQLLISHVGDDVYEVQLLTEDEALELFSRHAFREKSPKKDLMELSREVVNYAGRLPLALKVLGSYFYGQDKKHWREISDRLKKIPDNDILSKLRLSFDGLDKDEKKLFLDIVFVDIIRARDSPKFAVELLTESRGFQLIGIDYLAKKSLLSINTHNDIVMHSMIRQMGENVIREEYPNSRIWLPEEVHDLFKGKLLTENVESLCIPEGYNFEDNPVNYSNIFKRMQSLQVLIICKGTCDITYLPSSLRFIEWDGYPSISLLENFEPSQLVVLCLRESCLVEFWPISKYMGNLKHLDLSCSHGLRKTPNFGDMPNLETLILWKCKNLEEVHPSLGHCRMLTECNLGDCHKLKKLPELKLSNLKQLDLSWCSGLTETPNFGDMSNMETLDLDRCKNLEEVHPSLGHCKMLTELNLRDCCKLKRLPELRLSNLKQLVLSGCDGLTETPNFGDMANLETLSFWACRNLEMVHPSLGRCRMLTELSLSGGCKLKKLPKLRLSNLKHLDLSYCSGLTKTPNFVDMPNLETLFLYACENLEEVHPSLGHCRMLTELNLDFCCKLKKLPELRLSNLKRLCISYCSGLTETPNFGDMPNLETLDLLMCRNLEEVHPSLGHCRMLTELNLHGCCKHKKLPELRLSNLKHLDLRWCSGLTKTPSFGDMANLKTLDLAGCENLEEVHPSLGHCRMLTELNLHGCCKLKKLPELRLSNLKRLDLRWCSGLTETPNFGDMPNMETLDLGRCKNLEEVHPSLGHCRMLTELNLGDCCKLKRLPELRLSNLKQLVLSGCNGLTETPNFGDMANLKTLSFLACCNLEEVHPSLEHCRMLTKLSLSGGCKLKKLPKLRLSNLKRLDLSMCSGLTETPNFGDMPNLETLSLWKCENLEEVHPSLGHCRMLTELNLDFCCKLKKLPELRLSNLKRLELRWCSGLTEIPIGSLQSLENLDVSGSNISCLPKSIKELLGLKTLDVQFCQNLNELPEELPPNLENLSADYHLVLKSIKDLLNKCVKLHRLSLSWCGHEKNEYGTVSSEQVNVWKSSQYLIRTCIQCDYHQRDYFLIYFPEVRIPELFNYQFINQNVISIDLNPSWYTVKFMGFSICLSPNREYWNLVATLVCKSDPERKHSLKYGIHHYSYDIHHYSFTDPDMRFLYIPFETLWHASDNKEGKNPNDYYLFEVSSNTKVQEAYWGIHLEYENKDSAVISEIGCSMVLEQPDPSLNSSSRAYAEHKISTDWGLHLGNENKDVEVDEAAMAVQKEHESQNVELARVCESPSRKMGDASRKRKRKRKRKRNRNIKRKIAGTDETSCSYFTNKHA